MSQRLGLVCTFLVMGTIISGCDSSEGVNDEFETAEVQDLFTVVSTELELTADQQSRFKNSLRQHDHRDRVPGYLWIVADSLAETLDDEQKDALLNRTDAFEGFHPFMGLRGTPGGGGYYGFGGLRGAFGGHGESDADGAIDLSEDQRDAIKALHEAKRAEMKVLRQQHKDGLLPDAEFVQALLAMRDDTENELDAILTESQKEALAQFRTDSEADFLAFREAVWAVRDEVLELTEVQAEAFSGIIEDQLDMREVLMEQFQMGDITLAELRREVEELRATNLDAFKALLTVAQFEVVQIHAALVIRVGMRGHRRRLGGRG